MATKKKLLQAAAGQAGGAGGLNVEEVFSTYLYDGTGATQSITNDIDLSGAGGMTWLKARSLNAYDHSVYDTERGTNKRIVPNNTNEEFTRSGGLTSFNSDGFTLGNGGDENESGANIVSWTFRKAPKFFDVVTYTGTGSAQNISHNLGSVPAVVIVKMTSGVGGWFVYHSSVGATKYLRLETTGAGITNSTLWNNTAPTDTQFTVGTSGGVNQSGGTYVAYLFAHNDGDGEFGSEADQDIIKCGSYTGTGSSGNFVDLGFEPQWVMIKNTTDSNTSWAMFDSMRGLNLTGEARLIANSYDAEYYNSSYNSIAPTPTGFNLTNGENWYNGSGDTYIYIAIRRGPMAVPESGTDVFDIATRDATHPSFDASFDVVDFALMKSLDAGATPRAHSRFQGVNYLLTSGTDAETFYSSIEWDHMNGWSWSSGTNTNLYSWMWKRAPGFFDVVSYTGNLTAGHTINHNLGVAPEMIWVKVRNSTYHWFVYHSALTSNDAILLSQSAASFTGTTYWNDTDPTSSDFTLGTSVNVNNSAKNYIAYLFASLDGVSKVGSYTGNGSTQTIDCGFSSGARFILIKRTDSTGDWYVWDTERGIVAANDPHLSLNTTAAQVTTNDSIDPVSSGFSVNQVGATNINVSSASYIFYAIA